MNSATKNILKASIAVYNRHKEPLKFIAHAEANLERLSKQPLHKARGTMTQSHYQAEAIFLRLVKYSINNKQKTASEALDLVGETFNFNKMEKHEKTYIGKGLISENYAAAHGFEIKEEKTIDHSQRAHAKLSASGASKWTKCTPSAHLEEYFGNDDTEFAAEGTLAHEFAELNLKLELKLISYDDYFEATNPLSENAFHSTEMEEYVQKHVDYVIQQFTEAKRLTPGAVLLIEEKVDLTHLIEDSFGTCDDIIIADGVLEVIDLKYGLGVPVKAENNKQLMLYGSGALEAFDLMYDIHTVRLTIVQPRLDSIDSWEISAVDLRKWGEEELKPLARIAFNGEGELVTGDHCQFCKATPRCRARAEEAKKLTEHRFDDPRLLQDDELLEIFKISDQVGKWVKKVDGYVFAEAMAGKKWQGYKLVDGQNRRAWSDPEEALRIAEEQKYDIEKITTPAKIKGITELEKLATKALFPTLFGSVVMYKKTSPSLVPEDDKRPELVNREQQAIDAFDDDLL